MTPKDAIYPALAHQLLIVTFQIISGEQNMT
jgi:hypothetical protein